MIQGQRRVAVAVRVGHVVVGGSDAVVVQSMTNTDTADARPPPSRWLRCARAGSELVRITVNTRRRRRRCRRSVSASTTPGLDVPLIGDFHYNGHVLLRSSRACAAGARQVPHQSGQRRPGANHDKNFATMVECALAHGKPVRIGVNWGSLDQELLDAADGRERASRRQAAGPASAVMIEAMLQSALRSAEAAEELGLRRDRIVLSAKISDRAGPGAASTARWPSAPTTRCTSGLTEAGMGMKGHRRLAPRRLAILLQQGIGDTIRVSLTPEPGSSRTQEVRVAQQILQAMDIRAVPAAGHGLPRLRAHDLELLPGAGQQVEEVPARAHAEWRLTLAAGRDAAGRGDGLRRQRPRREQGTPTSASRCRARARRRARRSTRTASCTAPSRARPSPPTSAGWSTATSSAASARRQPWARARRS
jgi:(E)-4-hydroxy-3-methylbut-2-enyl-diphosphate synthase